jgi:DNA polymerase
MRNTFHFDYETTSECDIKLGGYRYAADPSTRILMFSIRRNQEKPLVWDSMHPDSPMSRAALALLKEAIEDPEALIYAHNAMFEIAVSFYRMLPDLGLEMPSIEKFRCTLAMCRRAAIPPSLAEASRFLKLGEAKDARGKALIGIFSDQKKLVTIHLGKEKMKVASPLLVDPVPWDWLVKVAGEDVTIRQAWQWFLDYCCQDTVVESNIHEALAKYELSGSELEGFQFDLRMNHRGAPVNVTALGNALDITTRHKEVLTEEFVQITGLQPSQTMKVLEWLQDRGYPGQDLMAKTMDEFLEKGCPGMDHYGARACTIRSYLSFAAVKKVPAMLNTACPDGRMRGLFNWYGAQRTGRWTSSGPQLQNARKPTIKDHHTAYDLICMGLDYDSFRGLYDNPYEVVASVIRNFVKPHEGRMISADYSNIESRVAALIAGQESMLQAYRDGRDLYIELASVIFNVPQDQVTKEQRFVAKHASLACIYQTGAKTFHETCAKFNMPIEKKLACHTVRVFRETNEQFPITWRRFETAAVKAINEPGKWFEANKWISFAYSRSKPFQRLLMRLPSGRYLTFPFARVQRAVKRHKDYETGETREWETDQISFWGSRQGYTGWGWVETYAGDLFQSSVQATARDIMQAGCVNAERKGFEIFSIIHDEALSHEGDPEEFVAALCEHPAWLPEDFPLLSVGALCDHYDK